MFSTTATALRPSPIQAMAERTRQARRAGRDVVDLTLGEPNFPTPPHISEAAVRAISNGRTHYTPIRGTIELREAVARKFERENGIACSTADIIVSCGAKQVIYQAFLATLRPGDEVVVAAPYWSSYRDIVEMNGGVLRVVATSPANGYRLRPEALADVLSARTRWVLLNSPSNPGGTAYSAAALAEFAAVLRASANQNVMVLSDDIYEHILFDRLEFATLAAVAPDLRDRVLTVNGVSKAYAMTGWRVGYACGPAPLIDAMTRIQMQINSHTSSISQAAAVAALDGPQDEVHRRRAVFEHRRDLLLDRLDFVPGLITPRPQGAFYVFPDVRELLGLTTPDGTVLDDDEVLASYLLDSGVAVVPGSGFGMPGFVRMSCTVPDESLRLAAARMKAAVEVLL